MNEKILIKSEKCVNYFIPAGIGLFVVGFLVGLLFGLDSIQYCIYLWSFSFYYVWPAVVLIIIGVVVNGTEIVVTDKRAYGKTLFGKRVDLPLDSISAVGSSWLKGIAIASSSGKISFVFIKNRDDIHKCISNLLIDRQSKQNISVISKPVTTANDAEELKKYKELFDSGVITQDEFNAKKKQILGL